MITLPIIILISLFTTPITADNSYCDKQLNQLHIAADNIKQQQCYTTVTTCCGYNDLYSFTKPSAVHQMRYLCGENWINIDVSCDSETAGGGWTVIQRRVDGSVDFNRPWSDYEKGFGDLNGEFWYGLRNMNCLTETSQWELRIDFEFENGTRSYLHYNEFKVGSAIDEYPLTIGGFTGITPTDPFGTHPLNGRKFTTYDNENDVWQSGNCAIQVGNDKDNGGWWYSACWHINLNIQYNPVDRGSILLADTFYYPRWIEMKIRPLNCTPQ